MRNNNSDVACSKINLFYFLLLTKSILKSDNTTNMISVFKKDKVNQAPNKYVIDESLPFISPRPQGNAVIITHYLLLTRVCRLHKWNIEWLLMANSVPETLSAHHRWLNQAYPVGSIDRKLMVDNSVVYWWIGNHRTDR